MEGDGYHEIVLLSLFVCRCYHRCSHSLVAGSLGKMGHYRCRRASGRHESFLQHVLL